MRSDWITKFRQRWWDFDEPMGPPAPAPNKPFTIPSPVWPRPRPGVYPYDLPTPVKERYGIPFGPYEDEVWDPNYEKQHQYRSMGGGSGLPYNPFFPYGPGNKFKYDPIRRQSVPVDPSPPGPRPRWHDYRYPNDLSPAFKDRYNITPEEQAAGGTRSMPQGNIGGPMEQKPPWWQFFRSGGLDQNQGRSFYSEFRKLKNRRQAEQQMQSGQMQAPTAARTAPKKQAKTMGPRDRLSGVSLRGAQGTRRGAAGRRPM